MLKEKPWSDGTSDDDDNDDDTMRTLKMTMTTRDPPGLHSHDVELTNAQLNELKETGEKLEVTLFYGYHGIMIITGTA